MNATAMSQTANFQYSILKLVHTKRSGRRRRKMTNIKRKFSHSLQLPLGVNGPLTYNLPMVSPFGQIRLVWTSVSLSVPSIPAPKIPCLKPQSVKYIRLSPSRGSNTIARGSNRFVSIIVAIRFVSRSITLILSVPDDDETDNFTCAEQYLG